jgi:hypothetical protein
MNKSKLFMSNRVNLIYKRIWTIKLFVCELYELITASGQLRLTQKILKRDWYISLLYIISVSIF